jgi:hypothetical protein
MVRAARTDANAKEIDKALKRRGATVATTDGVGSGFPDRVVGFKGNNFLLEYKDGSNPPSKRKLSGCQERWHSSWAGQVDVVTNPEEAIMVVFGVPRGTPVFAG